MEPTVTDFDMSLCLRCIIYEHFCPKAVQQYSVFTVHYVSYFKE